jgi:hypothetical protein
MPAHDTPALALRETWFALLVADRSAVGQERVFVRLVALTVACLLGLGRRTITQLLVALGVGDRDWTAWYRRFNRGRLDVDRVQETLLAPVVAVLPVAGPVVAAVDATQLPRSSRRMPGCGVTVNPRGFKWRRPLHLAQRFVGISLLLPRSEHGDSRAVPLRWRLLRTAKTTALGDEPERTESQGAGELVEWLRHGLDTEGRGEQPLLVLGDGAYSNAGVLGGLPARVVLVARCAKNRALYALPTYRPGRGRQRRYGERGPTPAETLHTDDGWREHAFLVRGRAVTVIAKVTGPWVVKGAPFHPVLLIVVRGVERGTGVTRRQRDPQYFLASVHMTSEDEWDLLVPLPELLAWLWHRWEVEVMHRELKSSFGLGEQQAFSARGAASVIPWLVWVYALVVLAAYRAWGYAPPPGPDRGAWWRPRRWSLGRVLQSLRQDLWQLGDFRPGWARSADDWTELLAWTATQLPTVLGARRL